MDRVAEWRMFLAVADHSGFARAAAALGRSPQAATRAIAALEARLGTRLFHRTTRAVRLTPAGARYRDRGRNVLAELDRLEARDDDDAAPTGVLTITAPVLLGQLHVVPIVTELLRRQPGVDARLVLTDRILSLADEGADLAVRVGELPDSALRARLVGHVRHVVCASPAYLERRGTPRQPRDLARHDCIALTGTTPIPDRWSFDRGGRTQTVAVHPRLVVNTGQAAIDAALAGLGITRVLSYQVDALVAKGRLAIVLASSEPAPRPVHLVQLPGAPVRLATLFADLAAERLRERLAPSGRDVRARN